MLLNQSCGDRPQLYRRRRPWTTTPPPPLAPPAPPLVVSPPPSRRLLLVAARRCGWSCDRHIPGRLFHCPRRGALWCICCRVTWSRPERSSLQRIIFLPTSSAVLLLFSCNVVFHVQTFLFLWKVFAGRGRDEVYPEELTSPSSSSFLHLPIGCRQLHRRRPPPPVLAGTVWDLALLLLQLRRRLLPGGLRAGAPPTGAVHLDSSACPTRTAPRLAP